MQSSWIQIYTSWSSSSVNLSTALVALWVVYLGILSLPDEAEDEVPGGQSNDGHNEDTSVKSHNREHKHVGEKDAHEVYNWDYEADLAREGVDLSVLFLDQLIQFGVGTCLQVVSQEVETFNSECHEESDN